MREHIDIVRDEAIDVLADSIVVMVRDETDENGIDGVAERAMLLAQHKLFGSHYMRELFKGNVPC